MRVVLPAPTGPKRRRGTAAAVITRTSPGPGGAPEGRGSFLMPYGMFTAWYYTDGKFYRRLRVTMVRDIAEGYILLAEPQLKKYSVPELVDQLRLEMEKSIRERRG